MREEGREIALRLLCQSVKIGHLMYPLLFSFCIFLSGEPVKQSFIGLRPLPIGAECVEGGGGRGEDDDFELNI